MANCTQCGRKLPPFSFKKICQWCVQHEAAQRGEIVEDARQPVIPAPWVRHEVSVGLTQVLFGACVAVFLGMVLATSSIAEFPGEIRVAWGSNFGPYTLSGQWWRLLTYMFLHGDIFHIAFNMWGLWNLGVLCESLYGRWTFAAIYLMTGIGGGLASVAWNPGVNSVGASGAIFGLAGALIASFYLGEFSLPSFAIRGTLRSLVFFAGFNLFFGSMFPGIDNACHVGGLVTGLVLGALIARLAPEHDNPLRRFVVLAVVALGVAGAGLGVQHWRGFPTRFGRAGFSENNIDRMIAALQKKIQQKPNDASTHYTLAHAYFAKGQFSEGEAELQRVLELQPQNTAARMDLGAAYLTKQQPKEAQDAFTKLLTQEPNNAQAHVGLGMALADQENHQAAIEEYKAALKLAPQASSVYYRMGLSHASLKQYDEAIAAYLKERDMNGDHPDIETALADAYRAKGMTQQAEDAKQKAGQLVGH
jgi:rhomboid protease GluP